MKCQEFEFIARDLARYQLMNGLLEADVRNQALAHAEQCATCAARLADERQLSASLRNWSQADGELGAGAHVESAVLAAFRQQPRPSPVAAIPLLARRSPWPRWTLAAAAVLLVGLLSWALRNWLPGAPQPPQAISISVNASPAPSASPVISAPKLLADQLAVAAPPPKLLRVKARPKRPAPRYRIERYLVESEIATDFMPLTDTSTWPRRERMQAVRLEMPRAVLASFGLPMSFERATEPVEAELLIGADGMARAIRFIQNSLEEPQIISANNPSAKEQ
jgi:hypothetical protein